jgi:sulfonate transport system substrate-binding protein
MPHVVGITRRLAGQLGLATLAAAMVSAPRSAKALATRPAPLPQRATLTVAIQERAGFMAPLQFVGKTLEELNITYKPVNFQRYPDSRTAILSGAVDVGATGAPQVIQDLANGGDRLIALQGVAGFKMYPVIRNGLKIASWADLKGKKVGVGVGGNVWAAFVAKLAVEKIAYTDLHAIGIQGSGQNFNMALHRGDIDVSICWSPFVEEAVVQGIGYAPGNLEFGYTQPVGPEQGMWVTTREKLAAKRALIERFLWAFDTAEQTMNASETVKLATIVAFTGLDPKVAQLTSDWITYGNNITPQNMRAMARIFAELGVVPKDVSSLIDKHYDLALYNEVRSDG